MGLPVGRQRPRGARSPPLAGGSARRPTRRSHLPYGHHSATTWRACPTRLRRGCRAAARFHPQGVGYQYVDGTRGGLPVRRRHKGWATSTLTAGERPDGGGTRAGVPLAITSDRESRSTGTALRHRPALLAPDWRRYTWPRHSPIHLAGAPDRGSAVATGRRGVHAPRRGGSSGSCTARWPRSVRFPARSVGATDAGGLASGSRRRDAHRGSSRSYPSCSTAAAAMPSCRNGCVPG